MRIRRAAHFFLSLICVTSLLITSAPPILAAPAAQIDSPTARAEVEETGLFRTEIVVENMAAQQRLERLDLAILEAGDNWAIVLVDEMQLDDLARLGFTPRVSDAVDARLLAGAPAWLTAGLQPMLAQATALQQQAQVMAADDDAITDARFSDLRATLKALTPEQAAALAATPSLDDDGDGLTNTQEQWWCTDSLNPDSDGDGTSDGDEVAAAKAWLSNEASGPPASGKPFSGWPPQISGCADDDQDSVPDLAERWELGLNLNRESTDRDKFDDGQELFGNTYCPGSGGYCGYGALPRNEDWGVIFAEMPSWVEEPGNHPLVAAVPVPRIEPIDDFLHLQTVAVVTSGHTIADGVERTYGTSNTEGVSSSVSEAETWNEWQEVSVTEPVFFAANVSATDDNTTFGLRMTGGALTIAGLAGGAVCVTTVVCGIALGAGLIGAGLYMAADMRDQMDDIQKSAEVNECSVPDQPNPVGPMCPAPALNYTPAPPQHSEEQEIPRSSSGTNYAASGGTTYVQPVFELSYPPQRPTRTEASGASIGGSRSTTHTQYEETTISNSEAFLSKQEWSISTAEDSSHTADLWFTYTVTNDGTEYAREIADLAFNLYIGDDPNPAYTYFVANDIGGDGKFHNFMPGEEHIYTSRRIPLTLDQMKAIDLGGPIRIVVEDFTYGIDELFYEDTANAGMLVAMEDGTDDGDETIDPYLIPTWGEETALDVLARYFPHETDADGTVVSIWTPEYRSDVPAWCQEPIIPSGPLTSAVWCKHALSTADWWNIYTNGLGDGSQGFQDTTATPGSVALFRFNKDSDLDGFSDRSELRLGTDPDDASSFPRPELLAGVHSIRSGNDVVATLSLLNTGLYDAYGVEAILVAPDDTTTITNNTVGGSGRVRALNQVIVGSRILLESPLPAAWTQTDHAVPAAGGYFTGSADRNYTFTVSGCGAGGCTVGSGAWSLNWSDDAGNNGSLNFADGYASPSFLPVGSLGLTLALYSGSVANDDSFTAAANTPRDTFQYTINQEPYTKPLVIVSYNDPQGNHRFIIPPAAMNLATPNDDLTAFSGEMLPDVGVEVVTTQPFNPGGNATTLLVNNPSTTQLTGANLFLEFIDPNGAVVLEVSSQADLPPGPSYVTINWDSNAFNPAYNSSQDYIVLAFLTDYEGNILDTGGRPLSSFQADPLPQLIADAGALTWDFGTVTQGALLHHRLSLANTGFGGLYTFINGADVLALTSVGQRTLGAASVADYNIALQTADLPVGPYDETFVIKSSDPSNPSLNFHVTGVIDPANNTPVGSIERPLDVAVVVSGPKSQGTWINFTHDFGPDSATLHPVKVYNQNYATLKGVGQYATVFSAGTAPADMFGDGRDGAMPSSGNLDNDHGFGLGSVNSGSAGSKSISITDRHAVWRIWPGDAVLIHQTQGTGAGNWEINYAVSNFSGTGTFTLKNPLKYTYSSSGSNRAQILRIPQYSTCNVTGTVTPLPAWNGNIGGIFAVMCSGELVISSGGKIDVSASGYRGSEKWPSSAENGYQGESVIGGTAQSTASNRTGGGGGQGYSDGGGGGSGGSHASSGTVGSTRPGGGPSNGTPATTIVGSAALVPGIFFGGAGGAGGSDDSAGSWSPYPCGMGGKGGNGGGLVVISARTINLAGKILARGEAGANGGWLCSGGAGGGGGGAGGAGGSVWLVGGTLSLGNSAVSAIGGTGGSGVYAAGNGGSGGTGRIRAEYCNSISGTTNPTASTKKLNCFITEQVPTSPYRTGRLNLPEAVSGSTTYQIQYGRKLNFNSSGNQTATLRVHPSSAERIVFDALLSNLSSGSVTIRIDFGNDGVWNWEETVTANANGAATLTSSNLAAAFNAYWAANGAPTSGEIDIPVRVSLSKAGQVLLTNLQVSSAANLIRTVQVPAATYDAFTLDLTAGGSGAANLSLALDVGDDGSIDWTYNGSQNLPTQLTSGNLAAAINAAVNGQSGIVNVPVRIYVAPEASVTLDSYSSTTAGALDLIAESVSAPSSTDEGATASLQATVRNGGDAASGPLTTAFFAALPDWGDWYIGSAFLSDLGAGQSQSVAIDWETTGFRGDVPIKVVVSPYVGSLETETSNNQTQTVATVRSRPDLAIAELTLSNPEPEAGETVSVGAMVSNQGQNTAGGQMTALYQGNPDDGGALVGEQPLGDLTGQSNATVSVDWTPGAPGLYRLFGRTDRDNNVTEYNEGNNDAWRDVYVGLNTPINIDSGAVGDDAYAPIQGYGFVDEGQTDITGDCGAEPPQSYRRDPDGRVIYQFDHLLPGHYYHLDISMMECVVTGRSQSVYVDDNLVAGPIDLGDGAVHNLSLRLDPALYADRSLTVVVENLGVDGALVNEIALVDVDYRYADAGGSNDLAYSSERSFGWLDGTVSTAWGALPYQSVRVDQADAELRYQFDNLATDVNYNLQFTFWQPSGQERIQRVYVDGIDIGVEVDTGDYQVHNLTAPVPVGAYSDDGSLVVTIKRLNGSSGAFVNEIALEEKSGPDSSSCDVQVTPYRMDAYGYVLIGGQPAPVGAQVKAYNPRGDVVGCFTVGNIGEYGLMPIYGEDNTSSPTVPGMRPNEAVHFKVNGVPAITTPYAIYSQSNISQIDLDARSVSDQSISLAPGWNLISTYIEPLLPSIQQALSSIDSRYDRALGEVGVYVPTADDLFNTLREFHSGDGYYLRTTETATAYLLIQGVVTEPDTPLELHAGWNWIGYLPSSSLTVLEALVSIDGLFDRVLSLDKAYVAAIPPSFNTLKNLTPGQGYLIYMNQAATLVYPTVVTAAQDITATDDATVITASPCDHIQPTPSATLIYGYLTVNDDPAPVGMVVEVLTPTGDVAGCIQVTTAGQYGIMFAYGQDDTAEPPIPGFIEGDELRFRVNGVEAVADETLIWQNDQIPHQIDLTVETPDAVKNYLPLIYGSDTDIDD